MRHWRTVTLVVLFVAVPALAYLSEPTASLSGVSSPAQETVLHDAARVGDLSALQARLQEGVSPDAPNAEGRTALIEAAAAGRLDAVRLLLARRASVNLASPTGETALIAAVRAGSLETARLLVDAGANLDRRSRGFGTALEAAERLNHPDIATLLREAGARTFGRSAGDTVCVRPWGGEGFCGQVEGVAGQTYRLRVTRVVGCRGGCDAKPDCSAGIDVGGRGGLREGDVVETPSWCVTDTDVRR